MRAMFQRHALSASNATLQYVIDGRGGFVVATGDNKRGHLKLVQPVAAIPILDGTDNMKLAGAVHEKIDLAQIIHCVLDIIWSRNADHMALVEDIHRF